MAIILTVVGIVVAILIPLCGFVYRRNRKLRRYYEVIWKKSSKLKHEDVLRERPFYKYYYRRPEDELVTKCLENRQNVLIIGPPLSGKSRATYQALTGLSKPHDVTVIRCTDINPEDFFLPIHLRFWASRSILIDDLHRFVEQQSFEHVFRLAVQNKVVILATCRSEVEHSKVKSKIQEKNMDLETIFGQNIIRLSRVTRETGEEVAQKVGINWADVKFNGTIGSVFIRLGEMERRWEDCGNVEKTILREMRKLYISGIYRGYQVFPLDWIKTVAKAQELEGKEYEWTGWLEELGSKEFIVLQADGVQAEEVYLEHVIEPGVEESDLEVFQEMLVTFSTVPEALFRLGNRVLDLGPVKLEKALYMGTAIRAYEEALKVYTLEGFPMQYAMTQNNLRIALDFCRDSVETGA